LEHLQELLKSIDAIIWELDANTLATTYVSPQLETILGYSLEQSAADPNLWEKIVHPADLPRVPREVRDKMATSNRFAIDYQACTADGQVLWINDITTVMHRGGEPALFRCVLTDATAEHSAIDALERNRQRLADAQRIAQMGDWEWDIPADEITWSDECFRIFGLEAQSIEMSFEYYRSLLDPPSQQMLQSAIDRTLQEGAPFVVEHPVVRQDGTTVIVRCYGELIRDESAAPICLRGTIQDVSDSRELEQLKDDLIALVSHELRTPLTPLIGILSLLSSDPDLEENPRLAKMITMANNNADRLVKVVDALLEIRELTGEPEKRLSFEQVDVQEVVREAIDMRPSLPAVHSISIGATAETIMVRADRSRLCEVIIHLLSNAAKFSPAHTPIDVSVETNGDLVLVKIRDHGKGIPKDFQERIFDRFAQADGPQSRNYGGIGLGLAISKAIIERHRGRIIFERAEGGGTLASIELPLVDSTPAG
jgi:PAS domain S-box-containing protein